MIECSACKNLSACTITCLNMKHQKHFQNSFQNRYYIENNLEIQIMFLSFHLKIISTFPPQNLFPFVKEIYLSYKVLVACKQMIQVENQYLLSFILLICSFKLNTSYVCCANWHRPTGNKIFTMTGIAHNPKQVPQEQ